MQTRHKLSVPSDSRAARGGSRLSSVSCRACPAVTSGSTRSRVRVDASFFIFGRRGRVDGYRGRARGQLAGVGGGPWCDWIGAEILTYEIWLVGAEQRGKRAKVGSAALRRKSSPPPPLLSALPSSLHDTRLVAACLLAPLCRCLTHDPLEPPTLALRDPPRLRQLGVSLERQLPRLLSSLALSQSPCRVALSRQVVHHLVLQHRVECS